VLSLAMTITACSSSEVEPIGPVDLNACSANVACKTSWTSGTPGRHALTRSVMQETYKTRHRRGATMNR
jgi:hypothetical protein